MFMLETFDQSLAIRHAGRQRVRHIRKDMAHTILRMGMAALAAASGLIPQGNVPTPELA
jgi:hypothetical protein